MDSLINQLKLQIIDVLNLGEMSVEEFDTDAPLFGEGLGLDSIDALELIVLLEKKYGIKLASPAEGKEIFSILKGRDSAGSFHLDGFRASFPHQLDIFASRTAL